MIFFVIFIISTAHYTNNSISLIELVKLIILQLHVPTDEACFIVMILNDPYISHDG
jgi:hypothetical protein